jgi:hypothetical protein
MYSLKGFKGKLSKKNFSHTNTYIHIFLVILIEIFILKITMCHLHDKNTKKKLKKRYSRLLAAFLRNRYVIMYLSFVFPANNLVITL